MFLLLLACTNANDTADADLDGDGFISSVDCDDHDVRVFPGASEDCNGADDDCDGLIDEGVQLTFYRDTDGDGYGDPEQVLLACEIDSGWVTDGSDCDDGQALVHPGAEESCTETVDLNCDGSVGLVDADGDGWAACEECDDGDPGRHPDAPETCNRIDDDCDGVIDDEPSDAPTWYADGDGDGYGDEAETLQDCDRPYGYVDNALDCDDAEARTNPGQWEVCNGIDDDCDGQADEDDALDSTAWYLDDDGDGYGDPLSSVEGCDEPSGYVDNDDDCDDGDDAVSPSANESCDGEDNDCDGTVDEDDAIDAETWYPDVDGDGYGLATGAITACDQPSNYSADDGDCLDSDGDVYPGHGCETDCLELLSDGYTTDGAYLIDPDGPGSGEDPIEVYCDMNSDGGGWTLCASLTKGYVPLDMLHNEDLYAFQARLNGDDDYVFETDAPSASAASWNNSESLNYGQFCRHMDNASVGETWIQAKMYNYANSCANGWAGRSYDKNYTAVYSGNLFTQWFTNTNASRSFSKISGDTLTVNSNNNGYGGSYVVPLVTFGSSQTHSSNPWGDANGSCVGCTSSSGCYSVLPYGQTTILNNTNHSFWSGIPNVKYGWSDCTANGNCNYHESGYGVWLFYVR